MNHKFCYGNHDGSCYIDHMETPPLKRCLNCSELIHPDSFGSECNPTPVEASTEEFIYVDWIPLFKWPQEIKND